MKPERRPYPGPAQITELSRNDVAVQSLRSARAHMKLTAESIDACRTRHPAEHLVWVTGIRRCIKQLDEAIAMLTALPEPDALDVLRSAQENGAT